MFWEFVERVTGVNRSLILDGIKEKAAQYVENNLCQCGHVRWVHAEKGNGACLHCTCQKNVPKHGG